MSRYLALFLCLAGPVVAVAKPPPESAPLKERLAERFRLEEAMNRLAKRTSWSGVERIYTQMLALEVPLSTHTHYTAALAAEANGDIILSWKRLERALREPVAIVAPDPEGGPAISKSLPDEVDISSESAVAARAAYVQLLQRYGRVAVKVERGRLPALVRLGAKPFSKTEREAISRAQAGLAAGFVYEGLLPIGRYMVDGEMFEIKAGELSELEVKAH